MTTNTKEMPTPLSPETAAEAPKKSDWVPRDFEKDPLADLKIVNAWAQELFRWAVLITEEVREFEKTQITAPNHIPDPPNPPFLKDPGDPS
jgi:hypothetical protein